MIANSYAQQLMQMDNSPFREIRQMLIDDLNRLPEEVQGVAFRAETRMIPPSESDEWVNLESTGKQWVTLTFADKEPLTFLRDLNDGTVKLGELPQEMVAIKGDESDDEGGGED